MRGELEESEYRSGLHRCVLRVAAERHPKKEQTRRCMSRGGREYRDCVHTSTVTDACA